MAMTVKQLIKDLKQYDGNLPIQLSVYDGAYGVLGEVTYVADYSNSGGFISINGEQTGTGED